MIAEKMRTHACASSSQTQRLVFGLSAAAWYGIQQVVGMTPGGDLPRRYSSLLTKETLDDSDHGDVSNSMQREM